MGRVQLVVEPREPIEVDSIRQGAWRNSGHANVGISEEQRRGGIATYLLPECLLIVHTVVLIVVLIPIIVLVCVVVCVETAFVVFGDGLSLGLALGLGLRLRFWIC